MTSQARVKLLHTANTPLSPPAVWTALRKEGVWKNWMLLGQGLLLVLCLVAITGLATRDPDVVLVDQSTGQSTYLNRSLGGEELARFLAERRQAPSDITIGHFSREFLETFLAVNSTTIDAEWRKSLSMMTPSLRERMAKEAATQRLLETYRAAGVRTELAVESLQLVERLESAVHVRAVVRRRKQLFAGGAPSVDVLEVDLVHRVVPRSANHPDGLEVAEYRNKMRAAESGIRQSEGGVDAP